LPLLKRRSRLLAEKGVRPPFDPALYPFDGDDGQVAVNQ
jgi:hypothetical protein